MKTGQRGGSPTLNAEKSLEDENITTLITNMGNLFHIIDWQCNNVKLKLSNRSRDQIEFRSKCY
jgi:hypothetical protein